MNGIPQLGLFRQIQRRRLDDRVVQKAAKVAALVDGDELYYLFDSVEFRRSVCARCVGRMVMVMVWAMVMMMGSMVGMAVGRR